MFNSVEFLNSDAWVREAKGGQIFRTEAAKLENALRQIRRAFGTPVLAVSEYGGLQETYDALPSTGGLAIAPAAYEEAFTSPLILDKSFGGILFMGPATITQGNHAVNMGATVDGAFMTSFAFGASGNFAVEAGGVQFIYTGSGTAITIGDASRRSMHHGLKGIDVHINGAGAGVVGTKVTNSLFPHIIDVSMGLAGSAATGHIALWLEGGFGPDDYVGHADITNLNVRGGYKGILTTNQVNNCNVKGGSMTGDAAQLGTIGIHRDGTALTAVGFRVDGMQVAAYAIGVNIDGVIIGDHYEPITMEQNDLDVRATVGSAHNVLIKTGATGITKTDAGQGNIFTNIGRPCLPSFTVAQANALPDLHIGQEAWISNESGGACRATHNGTVWRRDRDDVTIS